MPRIERIDGTRRLVVDRAVNASADTVWEVLIDTDRWVEWGPSVRAVESSDRIVQTGTTGRVRIPGGAWVPFEVTRCRDYRWTWRVARIPATGHCVSSRSDRGCRVSFDMPVVAGGYAPVCSRALDRIASIVGSGP